jgi:hypothetical protein
VGKGQVPENPMHMGVMGVETQLLKSEGDAGFPPGSVGTIAVWEKAKHGISSHSKIGADFPDMQKEFCTSKNQRPWTRGRKGDVDFKHTQVFQPRSKIKLLCGGACYPLNEDSFVTSCQNFRNTNLPPPPIF